MSIKYATRVLLLSALVAIAFACKKKEADTGAKAPESTQAEKAKEEKKVALPEPLQKMRDQVAAISSAAAGVERAKRACGAEKELTDLAASIKKLSPPAGVDPSEWESGQDQLESLIVGLKQACTGDGGGPEGATQAIESTLEQIRDQVDALAAYIAGDKGDGDKGSGT